MASAWAERAAERWPAFSHCATAAFGFARAGEMVGQQFRLALDKIGEVPLQRRRGAACSSCRRPRNKVP